MKSMLKAGVVVLILSCMVGQGYAYTYYVTGDAGSWPDWFDPDTWLVEDDGPPGPPAEGDTGRIGGGNSLEISGYQPQLYAFYVGHTSKKRSGGSLRVIEGAELNVQHLYVAYVGSSWGTMYHKGGTVNAAYLYLKYSDIITDFGPDTATYYLSGGTLNVTNQACLGRGAGMAVFNQTGGTYNARRLHLGYSNYAQDVGGITGFGDDTDVAYYNMTGGTLDISGIDGNSGYMTIGFAYNAQGHLKMGNEAGQTGTITGDGYLQINRHGTQEGAKAIVQGFGDIHMTGHLENNGMVIADGWGGENTSDRTLSMTTFSEVKTTSSKQLAGAGWYAQNRAKLVLPTLAVSEGSSEAAFGEVAGGTQRLVNSMKLDFDGVNGGDVVVSLLATDHSEAENVPGKILGVWSIDGSDFDFGSGSVDLTVRYDDALSAELELVESDLRFYHKVNGAWVDITTGVNTTNKLITASDVDSFSLFAVGEIPEPGTLSLLGIGGMLALVRRNRK